MPELFDMALRALRRDRAERLGTELFLYERTFCDCLERIQLAGRMYEHALLIGCPDPDWPERLRVVAHDIHVRDPGPRFAAAAGGQPIVEDEWDSPTGAFDLVLAIGTLDTVDDLPLAVRNVRRAMAGDGFFIGAMSGGDTLPLLRACMRAADDMTGGAAPHVHPRIEPSALAPLLEAAGFARPVVDIDRVRVSYESLTQLVADIRAMGATNILRERSPPLTRTQRTAAVQLFEGARANGQRGSETFEILHFAASALGR